MRNDLNSNKFELIKSISTHFLIVILLIQFSQCGYLFNRNTNTYNKDAKLEYIRVTNKSYDFVNSQILPENENTEYLHVPDLKITDPKRIRYGAGTLSYLNGKKIVALFFIDDDESSWDRKSTIDFTDNNVIPALNFLIDEAKAWGVEIDFEIWRFSNIFSKDLNLKHNGTIITNNDEDDSYDYLLSDIAQSLGYSNDMAFRWALNEKSGGIEVIPVFLLNKDGISCAWTAYGIAPVKTVEYAVVFNEKGLSIYNSSATFAHELLHLYGAEDLYKPTQRYNLTVELYPHDIMLIQTRNLEELKIDDFTAYTLGWNQIMPDICNNEEWYIDSSGYDN